METSATQPPAPTSPRFTLELEFVLCLANPYYLQYLAVTYPHLLNPPSIPNSVTRTTSTTPRTNDTDAARFARYLEYLYNYWRTPTYVKYLTHPTAVLRNLKLLQQEQFRKDVIRPDVIAKLLEMDTPNNMEAAGSLAQMGDGQDAGPTTEATRPEAAAA